MPLFIGSVFRDMDRERDIVTRIVIPAVNAHLARDGTGTAVYAVDLRWGVRTDEGLGSRARQRTVLELCCSEVRRCRPLFLGLLGSEYGWVPAPEVALSAAVKAATGDVGFPLSITAVEILTAARASARDGVAPVLMARQPVDDGARDMRALKRHLTARGFRPHPYRMPPDIEGQRLEDSEFALLATRLILQTVHRCVGEEQAAGWLDAELTAQRWAAEREVQHFVGRADELATVAGFWPSTTSASPHGRFGDDTDNPLWRMRQERRHGERNTVAVLGDSGSGKTALLAELAVSTERVDRLDTGAERRRAYVQIGATPESGRLAVCVLLLVAQLDPERARPVAERHTAEDVPLDEVLRIWWDLLSAGERGNGPLIVIDGLDRLVGTAMEVASVAWLPTALADRVRLVVSAATGSPDEMLLARHPAMEVLPLGGLPVDDAVALVVDRGASHHKDMSGRLAHSLVDRPRSARWLVVATDLIATLMTRDYLLLAQSPDARTDPEAALQELLETIAVRLPPELDRLHEEVYSRLREFTGAWFDVLLLAMSTAVGGLREQDLAAMLASVDHEWGYRELAVARGMLATHLSMTPTEWSFVHPSALDGARRYLHGRTIPGRLGFRHSRDLLVHHLLGLPVDDDVRVRELLGQLSLVGDHALVARLAADRELSTDASLPVLGLSLTAALLEDDLRPVLGLIDAAAPGRERLTAIEVVATYVLPSIRRDQARELVGRCRALLDREPAGATSRSGRTPAALRTFVDVLLLDFGDRLEHHFGALFGWMNGVLTGSASLRDAPEVALPTPTHERVVAVSTLHALIEYTLGVQAGRLVAADPLESAVARTWIDRATALGRHRDQPGATSREYFELLVDVSEWAASTTWPDAGFREVEPDGRRLQALVDGVRGSVEAILLMATCARVTAVRNIVALDGMDRHSVDAARLADAALRRLEDVLWQLELQREAAPFSPVIEMVFARTAGLHHSILSAFEQHAAAARSGVDALSTPDAVQALGWPSFGVLGVSCLESWCNSYVEVDPRRLIETLAGETDRLRAEGGQLAAELSDRIEIIVLVSALEAVRRLQHADLGVAMLERAMDLVEVGAVGAVNGTTLDALAAQALEVMDDDVLRTVEYDGDYLDYFDDDDGVEDRESLLATVVAIRSLRTALLSFRASSVADVLGDALGTALEARLLREPARHGEAQRRRREVLALPRSDEKVRRVVAAIAVLLDD